MTGISHSRVESYLKCRRADWYGYQFPFEGGRGLRRRTESASLGFGSAWHGLMATFYNFLLDAGDTNKAQRKAFDDGITAVYARLGDLFGEGYENRGGRFANIEDLLVMYFDNEPFVKQGYTVLAVEAEFNLEYDTENDLTLPFVIDLIVRDPERRIAVVDHKTAYNLYDEIDLSIMPQIPKYIAGLRALGHPAAYGIYNVIRSQKTNGGKMLKADLVEALIGLTPEGEHAAIKKMLVPALTERAEKMGLEPVKPPAPDQVIQVLPFEPNRSRIVRTFTEQMAVAEEIHQRDLLAPEEAERTAFRTANMLVCEHCQFFAICTEDLRGGNQKAVIANDYEAKPRREKIPVSNGDDD